jgi:hypothetical protein
VIRFVAGDAERLTAFHLDGAEVDRTIGGVCFVGR